MLGWIRPQGAAPKRMPKADVTELAPKKIGYNPPAQVSVPEGPPVPRHDSALPLRTEGCPRTPLKTKSPIFFGGAPERRPWAIKREDRPAAFAGRSSLRF